MAELKPEMAPDVVAACQAGAEEAAGALSRTFDSELQLAVGEASTYTKDNAPAGFDGAGLVIVFKFGDISAAAILPASTGFVPDWCADPDPTGVSKLSTLAQELSMLLIPETLMADDFLAYRVDCLKDTLAAGKIDDDAGLVALKLTGGEQEGELSLVWPIADADTMQPAAPEPAAEPPAPATTPAAPASGQQTISSFDQLPAYAQSLLKIEVPVMVTLASKKLSVGEVMDLGAGSIIKFEKTCEEPLELTVNNESVASGEVVKVGEKFGLKIHEMQLPKEHFDRANRAAS